jgi:hypothetical protein
MAWADPRPCGQSGVRPTAAYVGPDLRKNRPGFGRLDARNAAQLLNLRIQRSDEFADWLIEFRIGISS